MCYFLPYALLFTYEVAAPLKLDHYLNRAYWERKAGRTAGGGASVNTSNTPDSQQQEVCQQCI